MSLYFCIFDGDEEVAGWVFGHYSDFGCFRDTISGKLLASDYPTLMQHSDCDGEWSPSDLRTLRLELMDIAQKFKALPPQVIQDAFEHTRETRRTARNLYECFLNVDNENVFEALIALCEEGIRRNLPVLFQ